MCPMLVRCKECSQVIEVATLTEHLVMECEHRENYTQCSQCTEAVRLEDYENHSNSCKGKKQLHNLPNVIKFNSFCIFFIF